MLDVAIDKAVDITLILLISETVNELILSIKKSLTFAPSSLLNFPSPLLRTDDKISELRATKLTFPLFKSCQSGELGSFDVNKSPKIFKAASLGQTVIGFVSLYSVFPFESSMILAIMYIL